MDKKGSGNSRFVPGKADIGKTSARSNRVDGGRVPNFTIIKLKADPFRIHKGETFMATVGIAQLQVPVLADKMEDVYKRQEQGG